MREELRKLVGIRRTFRGRFERFGNGFNHRGFPRTTVLLCDITDEQGNVLADHIWFNTVGPFEFLNLLRGDVIEFQARVVPYRKGYRGKKKIGKPQETDFRLSNPTHIKVLSRGRTSSVKIRPEYDCQPGEIQGGD